MKKIIFTIILVLAFSTKTFSFDSSNITFNNSSILLNKVNNLSFLKPEFSSILNFNSFSGVNIIDKKSWLYTSLDDYGDEKHFNIPKYSNFQTFLIKKIGINNYNNLLKNNKLKLIGDTSNNLKYDLGVINYLKINSDINTTLKIDYSPIDLNYFLQNHEFNYKNNQIYFYNSDYELMNFNYKIYSDGFKNGFSDLYYPEVKYKIQKIVLQDYGNISIFIVIPYYTIDLNLVSGENILKIGYVTKTFGDIKNIYFNN